MAVIPLRSELEELYINKKQSTAQISKVFNFSQHKINYWLRKYKIKKRSISEAIYQKSNPNGDPFSVKKITTLDDAKLLGLGIGLYWGEGNKKNTHSIRLGNTDPKLIDSFIKFLVEILGIKKDKLRFGLQIFSDMNNRETLAFWLQKLNKFGINKSQFFRITVTPYRSIGTYKEKSKYGVLTVHFANVKLKKILDSMLPL